MQVAKIAQLLVVVGYWTGRLLRKLRVREKYGTDDLRSKCSDGD